MAISHGAMGLFVCSDVALTTDLEEYVQTRTSSSL